MKYKSSVYIRLTTTRDVEFKGLQYSQIYCLDKFVYLLNRNYVLCHRGYIVRRAILDIIDHFHSVCVYNFTNTYFDYITQFVFGCLFSCLLPKSTRAQRSPTGAPPEHHRSTTGAPQEPHWSPTGFRRSQSEPTKL